MNGDFNKVQVYKYVTKDKVLDIGDMLSLDPKRSKLSITLVEFDEKFKARTRVKHYVDSDDFKLVCWDILDGRFGEWTDHKGTVHDGLPEARVLGVRRDDKYRNPFVIKIDNGVGEVVGAGAVKMVQTRQSLAIFLPVFEARKLALAVLDYIRQWETVNFRKRQEARTVTIQTDHPQETAA
jgi:hypothetical protein